MIRHLDPVDVLFADLPMEPSVIDEAFVSPWRHPEVFTWSVVDRRVVNRRKGSARRAVFSLGQPRTGVDGLDVAAEPYFGHRGTGSGRCASCPIVCVVK